MLRFLPDLEREYRDSFFNINAMRLRLAHAIGLIGIFGFIFMDRYAGYGLDPPAATAVLLGLCCPALIVPMVVTFMPRMQRRLQPVIFVGALALGLGLVEVVYLGRLANDWFPYESIFLVTIYVYYLSGLLWVESVICGALIWNAYLGMNTVGFLTPAPGLVYEVYYLLIMNVIGMIGRYMFEYQDRLAFLMQRELHYLAQHDSLTNLLNRRAFRRQAERLWAQAARDGRTVGVLLLDLDHFKKLNDRYGHLAGDAALRGVAQVLHEFMRRPLDCAGRFGGDEFVAMWYDTDAEWFEDMCRKLIARLADGEIEHLDSNAIVEFSGGAVVAWPTAELKFQDILRGADDNLYESKRAGRGGITHTRVNEPKPKSRMLKAV